MSAGGLRREIAAAYRLDKLASWAARARGRLSTTGLALSAVMLAALLASAVLALASFGPAAERDALERSLASKPVVAEPLAAALPSSVESTELMNYVLKLSKDSAVEVVAIDARGAEVKRLGTRDYRAAKYALQLRAKLSQLVAFLNRLEQGRSGQSEGASLARSVFLENLAAKPDADQSWLISADLFALLSPT